MSQTSQRDGRKPDGAAIDLEGRVVVLEIVAMTAMALALDTSDNADARHAKGIAELIMETVNLRCGELGLAPTAQEAARNYATDLMSTALISLYPKHS